MAVEKKVTTPAPELLLAQLVQGGVLFALVALATYEGEYPVPRYLYRTEEGRPLFGTQGQGSIPINEFRASYAVLLLMAVSCAYFFTNLLLYASVKLPGGLALYGTPLILVQDVAFCLLMFVCSVATVAHPGQRAVNAKETQILIASGISMFSCVSSGVGVYYSYRVYKGI